jgi:hypothetical protein
MAELYANDDTTDHNTAEIQDESGTSMDHVLNSAQLLERILLFMRIKDLLVNAQRVSRQWKAIIDSSCRLQQALFFRPLPGGPVLWEEGPYSSMPPDRASQWKEDRHVAYVRDWNNEDDWENRDDWWNCLMNEEEFFDEFDEKFYDFLDWSQDDNVLVQRTVVFDNPFRKQVRRLYMQRRFFAPRSSRHVFESFEEALKRDSASWRRMLVCQPPIACVKAQRGFVVPDRLLNFVGNRFLTWSTLLVRDVDESEYKSRFPLIETEDVAIAQDVRRFDHEKIDCFDDWDPAEPTWTLRVILETCDETCREVVAVGCEPGDPFTEVKRELASRKGCSIQEVNLWYGQNTILDSQSIASCGYQEGTYIWAQACCCFRVS